MDLRKIVSLVLGLFVATELSAQKANPKMERMVAKTGTVCYGLNKDAFTEINPPLQYLTWKKNQGARVKKANITVDYIGFTSQAQAAFQMAVDIWSTLIYSPVPIHIQAKWTPLATGVLGSASPATYIRNFPGAQKDQIWYPVALAEKIADQELNASTDPDIVASFNSSQAAWYLGTTGAVPAGKYDLVSVVLHEIGHGLGITHSYDDQGQLMFGLPVIYETSLEDAIHTNLVESFVIGSLGLKGEVISDNLFFNSPLVKKISTSLVRIYAPPTYSAGSSIAHLDETAYPQGNINSLMTPFFNSAEKNHNPGPLVMAMLKDMGWNSVLVKHTPLKNTENVISDYVINANIVSDTIVIKNSTQLSYSYDGINFMTTPLSKSGSNTSIFTASIPHLVNTGKVDTIRYYLLAIDTVSREFTNPGKLWSQGVSSHPNFVYAFTAGPDTSPPYITHTPVLVVKDTDTQLKLAAILTDNIGVKSGQVEFSVNGIAKPNVPFKNDTQYPDSNYSATINFNVQAGDTIYYRIVVVDSAVAANTTRTPFYKVAVMPIVGNYKNDFNSASSDFIGDNLFSINTPSGFATGSIHTSHPYSQSDPKDSISYSYVLKYPVKLAGPGLATLKFDEIALVEPGAAGSTWPDPGNFYDYVIVEGSKDNVTWLKLINGYDCRTQSAWNTKWNSNVDANGNSLAVGDPSLYKTRVIDMLSTGYFKIGESIFIRFRLMSDQLAYGWGWSIDNLKIQIDETPPSILHDVIDFAYYKSSSFDLNIKPADVSGIKNLSVDFMVNNNLNSLTNKSIPPNPLVNTYKLSVDISTSHLSEPDEIEYRINATDSAGNSTTLPSTGFYKVPILNFKSVVKSYTSDFNSTNTDFVGNFFTITKPTGFSSAGINTSHPYANGFGIDNTSYYNFILKNPVIVNSSNPKMLFREIVIAEFNGASVKDYVVVEGSKDKGVSWHPFITTYSSNGIPVWQNAFNSKSSGAESMFKVREIDLTQSGDFVAGDSVAIRFRLYADAINNGWGWAIDDLSIQGPITAVEDVQNQVAVYPNPVSSEYLNIALPKGTRTSSFEMINTLGQQMLANELDSQQSNHQIFVGNLQGGVYLIKLNIDQQVVTKKIIVAR